MLFKDQKLILKKEKDIIFIELEDVLYFERLENKTLIHTYESEFYTRLSLKNISKLIDDCSFIRAHKSFVVNFNKIIKLQSVDTRLYEVFYSDVKVALATKKNMWEVIENVGNYGELY